MKSEDIEISEKTVCKSIMSNEIKLRKTLSGNIVENRLGITREEMLEMIKDGFLDIVVYNSGYVGITNESVTKLEHDSQRMIKLYEKHQKKLIQDELRKTQK